MTRIMLPPGRLIPIGAPSLPTGFSGEHRGALWSTDDGSNGDPRQALYRYAAWDAWNLTKPFVQAIVLHPGMVNHVASDAALRAWAEAVKRWGGRGSGGQFGGVVVTALYARRAHDWHSLRGLTGDKLAGTPRNDEVIVRWAKHAALVVAAWDQVADLLAPGRPAALMRLLGAAGIKPHVLVEPGQPYNQVAPLAVMSPAARPCQLF